jgi:hypothetical protein
MSPAKITTHTKTTTKTTTNPAAATPPALPQPYEEGYAKHKREIASVLDAALLVINLEVMLMVQTISGAAPKILALRPRIAALPEFNLADIDLLESRAFALGFLQGEYTVAVAPPQAVTALAAQVMQGRDLLVNALGMLARRGLVSAAVLDAFHGGPSHRVAVVETLAAAGELRRVSPEALARSGVTLAEIDEATSRAGALTKALGQREPAPAAVAAITRERQQAYTLAFNSYSQARRALMFLLADESAVDAIAPSLYAGRGRRAEPTDVTPVNPDVPAAPLADDDGPAQPALPALPALDPRSPGMNPFTS